MDVAINRSFDDSCFYVSLLVPSYFSGSTARARGSIKYWEAEIISKKRTVFVRPDISRNTIF